MLPGLIRGDCTAEQAYIGLAPRAAAARAPLAAATARLIVAEPHAWGERFRPRQSHHAIGHAGTVQGVARDGTP
jgi:hypothetical protein